MAGEDFRGMAGLQAPELFEWVHAGNGSYAALISASNS